MDKKKLNTIDLFAGCGGLMDGFEQTGLYHTVACVEWEKAPLENLKNRLSTKWGYKNANTTAIHFDIQRTDEILEGWKSDPIYGDGLGLDTIIKNDGKIDLIIGGPPCQAYSVAGRIRDENGMKDDYRNYLFESYLKVVNRYKPKAVIFENVQGMLSAAPDGILIIDKIRKGFIDEGYTLLSNFENAVFDVADFGVPQKRKRVILFAVNNRYFENKSEEAVTDFYTIIKNRKVKKHRTVGETILDLSKLFPCDEYKLDGKKFSHSQSESTYSNHIPRFHSKRDINIFKMLAEDIENGENKYHNSETLKQLYFEQTGKTTNVHKYHVLRKELPSNTIPAHLYKDGLRHIHPDPTQARSITVREAARLQTFSDDYVFSGGMMEQYKMIGNAVPPLFAKVIAEVVYEILRKYGV